MKINYGEVIKSKRKELGLSQVELAEKSCCCVETIWGLEHNARMTRLDIIEDILAVLGLEIIVKEIEDE